MQKHLRKRKAKVTRKDTKLAQKANKCKKECKELPVQKNRNQKRQQCPENQEEQRAQESQKQRTSKKHKLQAERKERDPTKCQKSCNHPKNFQLSSSGFFVAWTCIPLTKHSGSFKQLQRRWHIHFAVQMNSLHNSCRENKMSLFVSFLL